jgi:hypothetical protein
MSNQISRQVSIQISIEMLRAIHDRIFLSSPEEVSDLLNCTYSLQTTPEEVAPFLENVDEDIVLQMNHIL